jgi:hypothetical protein
MAKYQYSFTGGSKQVSTANQVIKFENPKYKNDGESFNNTSEYNSVEYLSFETFATACRIKLNDEDTIHWIDTNSNIVISDMMIYKVTVLDAGVEFYYTAFSTK